MASTQIPIQELNAKEVEFVDKYVSSKFLHEFGTSIGFNEFCKLAVKTGLLKTCAGGAGKRNKQAYATYLKSAAKFKDMQDAYEKLDPFTQQGMSTQVGKGTVLSQKVKGQIQSGMVYGSCLKQTVDQLKTTIVNTGSDISRKDLAGMKKAELCSLLDELLPNSAEYFALESGVAGSKLAYAQMPKATKKTGQAKAYEAYKKRYIPGIKSPNPRALMAQLSSSPGYTGKAPGAYDFAS